MHLKLKYQQLNLIYMEAAITKPHNNHKLKIYNRYQTVQSLRHVRLFVTPWTAACQASLSLTNSQNLLKLMSIESVMPSNHLILCYPVLLLPSIFPASGSFPRSQFLLLSGQSTGTWTSAPVLPMNIQD